MILKIGTKKIDFFNNVTVDLRHNTVASLFSVSLYFNPENPDHREVCRPCSYLKASIEHEGETLLTGTILVHEFEDSSVKALVNVSGYSVSGVLEDCEIPKEAYPLESNGISLKNIAEKIIKPFGIKLVVDDVVSSKVNANYIISAASPQQKIKSYLSELAAQRHVLLTHDEMGNLVMTESKASQASIFDFEKGMPGVTYDFTVNGQNMHNNILVQKQATRDNPNSALASIKNPYVSVYRPRLQRQSSNEDVNTSLASRNVLANELSNIRLQITLDRWMLNGKIIRPNNIITVLNPELFLFNKTKFFIEQVQYFGDSESQTAILSCVLPEVYNNQTPKNIFL